MRRLLLIALSVAGCACAPVRPWEPWRSPLQVDHPLAGQVLDARTGKELSPRRLVARLREARFALLGEQHDNPDHHVLQAWLVRELGRGSARRALALEMLAPEQRAALETHRRTHPADIDGLARALDWAHSGWPDWSLYRPLFAAAVELDLPLAPANLSRAQLAAVRRSGIAGLDPELRARTGLDEPLSDAAREQLEHEIARGHCDKLPAAALPGMVDAQRARDAQLAASLADAALPAGAVLIAGAGHVRRDRAVPHYLARAAPGASVVVVAFVEVQADQLQPGDYLEPVPEPPFDYVWLTPRADDTDPCEKFREPLERLRRGRPRPATGSAGLAEAPARARR
jgi:uncharacterized iron-regulated protein